MSATASSNPVSSLAILFSDDTKLTEEIQAALHESDVKLQVRKNLIGAEGQSLYTRQAFLVHLVPGKVRGHTIIEGLCSQNPAIGLKTIVITEGLLDTPTRKLIAQYQLRGYTPRSAVAKLLESRLEAIFDAAHPLRIHVRVDASFPVSFAISEQLCEGRCTSFSEGGMFIETEASPPPKSEISVSFQEPRALEAQVLRGQVLYGVSVGFAMRFEKNVPHLVQNLFS